MDGFFDLPGVENKEFLFPSTQGFPIKARVLVLNFAAAADVTRSSFAAKFQNQINLCGRYICVPAANKHPSILFCQ
jgi:hypothetical protein